jgi:hypothetical protein
MSDEIVTRLRDAKPYFVDQEAVREAPADDINALALISPAHLAEAAERIERLEKGLQQASLELGEAANIIGAHTALRGTAGLLRAASNSAQALSKDQQPS